MIDSIPEPRESTATVIVRIGIRALAIAIILTPLMLGCGASVLWLGMVPMMGGEHRETHDDASKWTADLLRQAELPPRLHFTDARAESVSDGSPGDGFDWCRATISTDEIAMLRSAMSEHVGNGKWRASKRTSAKDGNPPDWWWPHEEWDLIAVETASWYLWVGVSPSSGHLYVRRARA